jgi:hypothetical protein
LFPIPILYSPFPISLSWSLLTSKYLGFWPKGAAALNLNGRCCRAFKSF